MSAGELFGRELWESVAEALTDDALSWWEAHKEQLTETGKDEAKAMFAALKNGSRVDAKFVVGMAMMQEDREAWVAYRDGNTAKLMGVAKRRSDLLDAIGKLGEVVAKTVGGVALGVLGL